MTNHRKGWTNDGFAFEVKPMPDGARYRYFIEVNHGDLQWPLESYANDWLAGIEKLIREANKLILQNNIRYM